MRTEFIIWGKTNPVEDEKLLVSEINGKKLTSTVDAHRVKRILIKKHLCTEIRIQEVNLDYPDCLNKMFIKSINI